MFNCTILDKLLVLRLDTANTIYCIRVYKLPVGLKYYTDTITKKE